MERIVESDVASSLERAYSCHSICGTSCSDEEQRELKEYDRHILLAIDGTAVSSSWHMATC
jgi:hypothetical protein